LHPVSVGFFLFFPGHPFRAGARLVCFLGFCWGFHGARVYCGWGGDGGWGGLGSMATPPKQSILGAGGVGFWCLVLGWGTPTPILVYFAPPTQLSVSLGGNCRVCFCLIHFPPYRPSVVGIKGSFFSISHGSWGEGGPGQNPIFCRF